jgi:hypothetical protein
VYTLVYLYDISCVAVVSKSRMLQLDSELAFYQDLMAAARSLNPSIAHGPSLLAAAAPSNALMGADKAKPRSANRPKRPVKKEVTPVQGPLIVASCIH